MDKIVKFFSSPLLCLSLGALATLLLVAAVILFIKKLKKLRRHSRMLGAQLREIGEFAVEEARCTLVHCTKEPRQFFGKELPLMRERCIFAIDAVVKIGFDFDDIRAHVDPLCRRIVLHLPEMRILSNTIDYDSMEIFDEKTSVFARPKLEWHRDSMLHLAQEAEKRVQGFGAFERAEESAKTRLTAFVAKLFDLTEYRLEFVSADGERQIATEEKELHRISA